MFKENLDHLTWLGRKKTAEFGNFYREKIVYERPTSFLVLHDCLRFACPRRWNTCWRNVNRISLNSGRSLEQAEALWENTSAPDIFFNYVLLIGLIPWDLLLVVLACFHALNFWIFQCFVSCSEKAVSISYFPLFPRFCLFLRNWEFINKNLNETVEHWTEGKRQKINCCFYL